jgi:DNA polymerase V
VVLERTVRELQGVSCIGMDDSSQAKQEIACTHLFEHVVTELGSPCETVTEFASVAAEKLRRQNSHTS